MEEIRREGKPLRPGRSAFPLFINFKLSNLPVMAQAVIVF